MIWCNDNDRHACAWARELMRAGLVPEGTVDERDIREVRPADLAGFDQCHFFAGILGWPYALQLAGWPAGRPVWTASCPCQPFSKAGRQRGEEDPRHLWPVLSALVRECHHECLFGEQVAGAAGLEWLDGVRADLESQGYAFGAADLPAACVGAPHIRQRLFWVAHATGHRRRQGGDNRERLHPQQGTERSGEPVGDGPGFWDAWEPVPCRDGKWRRTQPGVRPLAHGIPGRVGLLRGYGNSIVPQVAATFIRAFLEVEGGIA